MKYLLYKWAGLLNLEGFPRSRDETMLSKLEAKAVDNARTLPRHRLTVELNVPT